MTPPLPLDAERRLALERLSELLWKFGTANDAQDHDCRPEAMRLRRDAAAGIRALMGKHPFIAGLFPGLGPALESRGIEACSWSTLVDAVEAQLGSIRGAPRIRLTAARPGPSRGAPGPRPPSRWRR